MTLTPATNFPAARRLEGRVAIVTGGNKGLGRTSCLELAREGANVAVVAGHDLEGARTVASEVEALGSGALALAADITDAASVRDLVQEVHQKFGAIDILVNSAGGGSVRKPLEDVTDLEWDRVFDLNTKGTFLCSAAVARVMKGQGRGSIINIAGASAHRTYPRYGGYGPAKAAVIAFTAQACIEWARFGIRVNGVSPGPIRDPGTGWEQREPELAREVRLLPMERAGSRMEIARTVAFLASDDAGYINGQMIIVDGGGVHTWYLSASDSRREGEANNWR